MFIAIMIAVWICMAMVDYYLHYKSGIHRTGVAESGMHLLLIAQVAIGFAAAIVLQPGVWTAVFLAIVIITHAVTSLADIHIAIARRRVTNLEHAMHYGLNLCPIIVASIYIAQYPQPSITYITTMFASIALLVVVPYLEEFIRCWRNRP